LAYSSSNTSFDDPPNFSAMLPPSNDGFFSRCTNLPLFSLLFIFINYKLKMSGVKGLSDLRKREEELLLLNAQIDKQNEGLLKGINCNVL